MAVKSIKKNYIYNVSYQLLVLITPLITTPYLSRILGADGVGTASYIESIVSYFTLFATMGITTFAQREISYIQDSREKRTQVFWEIVSLEFITTFATVLTYLIFASLQENSSLYLVLVFNIVSVLANITWLFQGMEEFGRIVLRNFIFKFINIIYIFIFIRKKEDLVLYLLGISLFALLSNISLWFYLPEFVGRPVWKEIKPFKHIKVIMSLFIPTIAIQVYTVLDKTMIGLITQNSFENGYYEQAIKISKIVMTVVTALGTVMIPRIGYHFEKGESDRVRQLMYRGYRFVWFLGIPLCLGLGIAASNFVPWFFGDGYDKVIPLISILSFLIIAIGINNVTGMQYLIPTKRQNIFSFTVIVGACTNFILNIVLIPRFASIGAAVSTVIAETVIAVVQIMIVRDELSPWIILREGKNYYIAGMIMAAIVYFMSNVLSANVLHTGIIVFTGGVVYFILLAVLHDEFLFSNLNNIFGMLKKK